MKTKSQLSHRTINGERPMHGAKGQLFRTITDTPSPEDKMVILFENLDLMWYQGQMNHARELYKTGADIAEITEALGRKGTDGQYETLILLLYLLYKGKIKARPGGFLGEFQRIGGVYYSVADSSGNPGDNTILPGHGNDGGKGACA